MSDQDAVVNEPVEVQESTPAESTPAENKSPEVAPDAIEEALRSDDDEPSVNNVEEESKPKEKAPKEEESQEAEEPEAEQPRGKADERKQQLNTEIRGLVEQRKQLREEIEQLNSQVYQPRTAEELVQEGYSPESARVAALEEKIELSEYNSRVVEAQMGLEEQAQRVFTDFPLFNPDSEEYDPEIADTAAEALRASLIHDPNTGQVIGSHLSPYQIYKPIADAYKKSQLAGQIKGQQATEKMLASVDAQSSVAPTPKKKDPIQAILASDDY